MEKTSQADLELPARDTAIQARETDANVNRDLPAPLHPSLETEGRDGESFARNPSRPKTLEYDGKSLAGERNPHAGARGLRVH